MKFSISVSVPEMEEFSFFEEKVHKVSELGYEGIELGIRDPRTLDEEKLVETVSAQGLDVSCIATGAAYAVDGLSLTHLDSRVRSLAISRIKDHISLAGSFGAIVLIGWIRGMWKDNSEQARKLFLEALRECGMFAENKKVLLGIEPINRYEVDSIHTIHDSVMIVKRSALPNLGIVADTFHMNIEENEPIDKSIRLCGDHLLHVHVADNNRRIPGTGCLPFAKFLAALKEIKYHGFVSVELIPMVPDFATVAEQSITFLRRVA